jgi:hypothetical protein
VWCGVVLVWIGVVWLGVVRFGLLLEAYCRGCGSHMEELTKQVWCGAMWCGLVWCGVSAEAAVHSLEIFIKGSLLTNHVLAFKQNNALRKIEKVADSLKDKNIKDKDRVAHAQASLQGSDVSFLFGCLLACLLARFVLLVVLFRTFLSPFLPTHPTHPTLPLYSPFSRRAARAVPATA